MNFFDIFLFFSPLKRTFLVFVVITENKKNVDIMSFVGIWEFTWKIKKS